MYNLPLLVLDYLSTHNAGVYLKTVYLNLKLIKGFTSFNLVSNIDDYHKDDQPGLLSEFIYKLEQFHTIFDGDGTSRNKGRKKETTDK